MEVISFWEMFSQGQGMEAMIQMGLHLYIVWVADLYNV